MKNKNEFHNFCRQIGKTHFGYSVLKDYQQNIIDEIYFNKRDVLGIIATGGGKSFCYQIFNFIFEGSIIVISPLIALIQDQIDSLLKKNINALSLTGQTENRTQINNFLKFNKTIIYTTPEYIIANISTIKEINVSLIAIDESHCISSWGHDFREQYLNLYILKDNFNSVPFLALTATATIQVKNEIIKFLKLNNPFIIQSSFDRPNIKIFIYKKNKDFCNSILFLKNLLADNFAIVYCSTRNETENISKEITKTFNFKTEAYHAGMDFIQRKEIQDRFINGITKIIVSTVAFGMGIDQNINYVIHWGLPRTLENYYQEIGRAGRDGTDSNCYLFYNKGDICKTKYLIKKNDCDILKKKNEELFENVIKMATGNFCRRKFILNYFNEKFNKSICFKCDYCLNSEKEMEDYSEEVFLLINCIKRNFGFGLSEILKIIDNKYPKSFWMNLIESLRDQNLLEIKFISNDFNKYIILTNKINRWFNNVKLCGNYKNKKMVFPKIQYENILNIDL
jgi:ATP-dependent DNA helicase RecQ